jgi:hypothetical protein
MTSNKAQRGKYAVVWRLTFKKTKLRRVRTGKRENVNAFYEGKIHRDLVPPL